MIRAVVLLIVLAAFMLAAAWFADRPGDVEIAWEGWKISTSVPVLVAAIAVFAAVVALLYRFWRAVIGAPRAFGRWRREKRRRQGYVALTQGMVAVAAGDPDEARRQARRADVLLNEPPLTMLLSAQAAQLNGDENAASRYFTQMLERRETEFLGLRGLLIQAMRKGDHARAMELARRARALRPRTPWLLTTLFELETRTGDWRAAADTLGQVQRAKALPAPQTRRHEAAVLVELSRTALANGRGRDALRYAEQAHRADPDHLAATIWLAERYADAGKARAVERVVEQQWARAPHPDLLAAYRRARPVGEPLQWVKQAERLTRLAPLNRESMIALGLANLDAKLWGEARRHFVAAVEAGQGPPSAGLSRLMARLEEEEGQNPGAVREWLAKAAEAPPDAAWVCEVCGAAHARWQGNCSRCGGFDKLVWRAPARVQPVLLPKEDDAPPALPPVGPVEAPPGAPPPPA